MHEQISELHLSADSRERVDALGLAVETDTMVVFLKVLSTQLLILCHLTSQALVVGVPPALLHGHRLAVGPSVHHIPVGVSGRITSSNTLLQSSQLQGKTGGLNSPRKM